MQQSIIDRTQEVLWRHLGDAVKVFTPGATSTRTIQFGPASRFGWCRMGSTRLTGRC